MDSENPTDLFHDLDDNVVLLIIKKFLEAKVLLQLSLVCKRFFKLVFQTDSLIIDFNDPCFHLDCARFLARNRGAHLIEFNRQKLYPILQKFQEIKALKVDFRFVTSGFPSSTQLPLSTRRFHKMLAGFGKNFEFCHYLSAKSLDLSVESEINMDDMQHLTQAHLQRVLLRLTSLLDTALTMFDLIVPFVLENKELKCVVLSDPFRKIEVVMDEKQIAALRNNEEDSTVPERLGVIARRVSALRLPKLGYTMNDVHFASVITHKDTEAVEEIVKRKNPMGSSVFRQCGWVAMKVEDVKAMELPVVDFLDFKDGSWAVFEEAFGLLLEDIKVNP